MSAPTNTPATDSQITFLGQLIRRLNLDMEIPLGISKTDASALIDELVDEQRNRQPARQPRQPAPARRFTPRTQPAPVPAPEPAVEVPVTSGQATVGVDKTRAVIEALEAAIAVLRSM